MSGLVITLIVQHGLENKMNKYDWSGVDWSQAPEWARFWSITDYNVGRWHGNSDKPIRNCGCAFSVENCWESEAPTFGYKGNWQDSLEERPND